MFSNDIKRTVKNENNNKYFRSFLVSLLSVKKYKKNGKIINIKFNFSLRLKKKFIPKAKNVNTMQPKIMFSKKLTLSSLIRYLLNIFPEANKLKPQKKLTKKIVI